jgi:hypothetical protein
MTERHSTDVKARTRQEAIAAAEREGFTGGEHVCLGFTASRIPNDLPQPQPPGSQAPSRPRGSESPATAENRRDGGCWLQGAG